MSGILLLFLIGAIGTCGVFYLLKIPINVFNIMFGLAITVLFGTHMFLLCLVALGVLYVKEKIFPTQKNG
jgi:hypothetical protein